MIQSYNDSRWNLFIFNLKPVLKYLWYIKGKYRALSQYGNVQTQLTLKKQVGKSTFTFQKSL